MICRSKLPRWILVCSLMAVMLVNGTVRAACLCTDGQSKVFCGKLFELMVLGHPEPLHVEPQECCCENCARQHTEAQDSSQPPTDSVENRQCQPIHSVMDYKLPEIQDLSGLIHLQTIAIDEPILTGEATRASLLDLLRERGGSSSFRAQLVSVLLI